ncbi:MAG: AMP-binding protein [Pseudomonadota bacterium]
MVGATSPSRANARLDTIPKLLLRNGEVFADRPAFRHKDLGIWQTWTWSETRDEIRNFAVGLSQLGVQRGDRVAIVGSNRTRLYWTFAAVQSIGGIPVPVYADAVADEMAYVLSHAEVRIAVVEDQEQVDKLLSVADRLPNVERVIYDEARGLQKYDDTYLHAFADVQKLAETFAGGLDAADRWWRAEIDKGVGSDVSVTLYTSGTTGTSKGVLLTHERCIGAASDTVTFDKLKETDETLAYLPLAWVGDHYLNFAQGMVAGFTLACPERPETIQENLREIGPSFYFAPPRVFETLLTDLMIRMEDAGALKRGLFKFFLGVAKKHGENILNGKSVSPIGRIMYAIGQPLVFGPLKNRLGFSNIRVAYTAGEAIGPELFAFYRSLGLNLKQLYGQTEAFLYVTAQPDGEIFSDTVGPPAPNVELKLSESGEVLFKSPGMFVGYYKDDEKTAETLTEDGFVRTGDAGFFDDRGHLKIIDRAKDVGRLVDGSLFPPKYVENKLKFFPNIKEAVVFGNGREFATAMLNIDLTAVGNWAERNNIIYASYQELAGHPQVYEMLSEHVAEVNASLAGEERVANAQIRRFLILHKELDADDGEITRTQKVRRSFIADRYAPMIEALYNGSERCQMKTEVVFEDGRRGVIEGDVRIVDMATTQNAAPIREAAE